MVRCFLALAVVAAVDLLASTSITQCVDDGSAVNCSYKLVVTAAIQNAEVLGTGSFAYSLARAAGGGLSAGATSVGPIDGVSIVVTQSAIRLIYPLTVRRPTPRARRDLPRVIAPCGALPSLARAVPARL